jgi:hypothetical protein
MIKNWRLLFLSYDFDRFCIWFFFFFSMIIGGLYDGWRVSGRSTMTGVICFCCTHTMYGNDNKIQGQKKRGVEICSSYILSQVKRVCSSWYRMNRNNFLWKKTIRIFCKGNFERKKDVYLTNEWAVYQMICCDNLNSLTSRENRW